MPPANWGGQCLSYYLIILYAIYARSQVPEQVFLNFFWDSVLVIAVLAGDEDTAATGGETALDGLVIQKFSSIPVLVLPFPRFLGRHQPFFPGLYIN